jgi:hypothetical protein
MSMLTLEKNHGRGSAAVVARSFTGDFLGASAHVFPRKTEACLLADDCALGRDIHARTVQVASDCSNVIQIPDQGGCEDTRMLSVRVWILGGSLRRLASVMSVEYRIRKHQR